MELLCRAWGAFLGALGFPVQRYICFRPYVLPVVVGLCLGITIHMMFVPFFEEGCDVSALRRQAAAARSSNNLNTAQSQANVKEASGTAVGNDEFEARIVKPVLTNVTVDKNAARPKVARPRYISTELGIREKLFVAVLTSANSVDKLGVAVDKTLSKHVTKTIFFSTLKPNVIPNGLPMVAFGDRYPEQLPIHVLRYIREHYSDTFDFYLFISDRTYLRAEKFFSLVQHISVKDDVYMGVPGVDKTFCGLEGGVLLSQSVMGQLLGNLDWCTKNAHPTNPSVNLGRCIHHASQKLCSPRGGEQSFQYYQLQDFVYDSDIGRLRGEPSFNQSLTFYPMPDDTSLYKLHRYFCHVDLNETRHEIEAAKADIMELSQHSPGGRDSLQWPIGVQPPFKPANRYSVIQWTYFTDTHLYLNNELSSMMEISGADKLDIADIKKTIMSKLNQKYPSRYSLRKIVNGYRRFDPTRGMEYILDLLLIDDHQQSTEILKRVQLLRPLGKVELVPMPYVTENMMVNIILPLSEDQLGLFDQFLESYVRSCLQGMEDVRLIVVLLNQNVDRGANSKSKDIFSKTKTAINNVNKKYDTKGKLTWKVLDNSVSDIMIMDDLQNEFKTDALILMTTVNMEMSPELTAQYLNRVRMNTIKGKQVFFPMGFWQYKPNLIYDKKPYPASVEIAQRLGQFSTDSFEHCSFYTSDYKAVRKMLSPTVVRSSDIFNMFVTYKNLHVFRAIEPNLKLKWMNLTCDPRLSTEKYQKCVTRNVEGLASQRHLALLIYKQRNEVIDQSDVLKRESLILNPHQENLDVLESDPKAEGMILMNQKKVVK